MRVCQQVRRTSTALVVALAAIGHRRSAIGHRRRGAASCALLLASCFLPLAATVLPPAEHHAAASGQGAPALRAGVARIDITPEGPVALQGYLNPEHRISEGVHDRLFARAIAFASGSRRFVLVSADLASFSIGPYFQHIIAQRLGLRPEEILLCAIHTHSGPQLSLNREYPHPGNAPYTETLAEKLVTVADRALRALGPVRISVGRSTSRVGMSRRTILPDGRVEMLPNPSGISDPELLALRIDREGGGLLAVLFSYACHSRSLRSPNRLVSGDVLGIAEQRAESRLGGQVMVAAFAGASADVDPERVVDTFAAPGGAVPETVRLGEALGNSVVDAVHRPPPNAGPVPFRFEASDVQLPRKHGGTRPLRVVTAAIGDIGVAAFECEASTQIGLAVKAASPFTHTFVATICHAWGGYLPATSQYAEGGYEVDRSPYAPGAADTLVDATVGMLKRLAPGRLVTR